MARLLMIKQLKVCTKKKKFVPTLSKGTLEMLEEGSIPFSPWRQTGTHKEPVVNTEV